MVARGKYLDIGEFCKEIQERGEDRDNTRGAGWLMKKMRDEDLGYEYICTYIHTYIQTFLRTVPKEREEKETRRFFIQLFLIKI